MPRKQPSYDFSNAVSKTLFEELTEKLEFLGISLQPVQAVELNVKLLERKVVGGREILCVGGLFRLKEGGKPQFVFYHLSSFGPDSFVLKGSKNRAAALRIVRKMKGVTK